MSDMLVISKRVVVSSKLDMLWSRVPIQLAIHWNEVGSHTGTTHTVHHVEDLILQPTGSCGNQIYSQAMQSLLLWSFFIFLHVVKISENKWQEPVKSNPGITSRTQQLRCWSCWFWTGSSLFSDAVISFILLHFWCIFRNQSDSYQVQQNFREYKTEDSTITQYTTA